MNAEEFFSITDTKDKVQNFIDNTGEVYFNVVECELVKCGELFSTDKQYRMKEKLFTYAEFVDFIETLSGHSITLDYNLYQEGDSVTLTVLSVQPQRY